VDIQLRRLERMLADREVKLTLTDQAKDRLVELGYDPAFGARPLRRAIVRELQNPLAEFLLSGTFGKSDVLVVGVEGRNSSSPRACSSHRDGPGVGAILIVAAAWCVKTSAAVSGCTSTKRCASLGCQAPNLLRPVGGFW